MEDVSVIRLLVIKAMLEEFPECRVFARGYLLVYLGK